MPVPNNTFPLDEYIKAIENPDKRGLVGNRWFKSPRRVDDPNNRGYGVDIRYNEKAKALTEGRPGKWLSVAEEEKLRQDHIKESQRAAREHFHEYLRQQPLTPKREALAVGMLYRGDGINKHREVADAYYNGTEEELQEAITKYYEGKQPERAKLHKKFIEKTSEEISNNNKWDQLFNQEQFQAPSIKAEGGSLKDVTPWNNLSVAEKAEMMRVAIHNGIFDLPTIKARYNEFAEGGPKDKGMTGMMNLYSEGGYAPSEAIKSQIAKWEGSATTGAIDPLSGKYSKNNSFEAEAKGFYNALPKNIRAQVLSNPELADHLYSYSYNVGAGNFKKRVVPALEKYYSGNGSIEDVVDSMWASGDSKLKGLQIRRAVEKTGVRQALLNDAINSTNAPYIPVIPEVFNTPAETPTYQTPIYALEDLEIPAYQPTAEEVERQNRRDALDRFNTVMQLLGIDNPIQAAYPTTGNSFLDVLGALNDGKYSEGGGIHIKPENRGKFTALKERTGHSATWFKEHGTPAQKKMAIFDLNSRHWKHGDGGDLHIYNGGELPEITVTAYAPLRLTTYYPVTSKYPYTGHSKLDIPIDRQTWYNYTGETLSNDRVSPYVTIDKKSSAKDYNLVTNNCADATLKYLNAAFGTSESPWLFTTPGDVRDYALKELNGKLIKNNDGSDTVLIPRNAKIAPKLSKTALNMYDTDQKGISYRTLRGPFNYKKRSGRWKHGLGGNLFGMGGDNPSIPFWQQSTTPQWNYRTPEQIAADAQAAQQRRAQEAAAIRQKLTQNKKIEADIRKRQTDYLTTSNDNTWVESRDPDVRSSRPKNPHLKRRSIEGAKDHAAWEQNHPIMNAVGITLGAAPFAVAAAPAVTVAGDALAGSIVGQGITSLLTNPYFDAAMTSLGGAHAARSIANGEADWMTALELTPLGRLARPMWNASKKGLQYTAKVADNTARYVSPSYDLYRTIGGTMRRGIFAQQPTIKTVETPTVEWSDAVNMTPKVNWDADNWFKTISGRSSYSSEEAAELASHVPEYRAIEQRLFNEGKLIYDSNGNIIVDGYDMSPQEYIMRQSEAFQKMNPEHHYVGVSKRLRDNFENEARDPNTRNKYEVWTDRKSPKNVEEYALSQQGGYTNDSVIERLQREMARAEEDYKLFQEQLKRRYELGITSKENYDRELAALRSRKDNYTKNAQQELDVLIARKQTDPLNGGKIFDVTYPKEAVETPIIDAENSHWSRVPFDNVVRDAPNVVTHYKQRPFRNELQTDQIVSAARRNGYGVTHIDNVMDTYNGTMLDETIIGRDTPVKSVLGNTGSFDIESPNKWRLYRSLIPPFLGSSTLGTTYGASQKAYGGNLYDEGGDLISLLPTINIPEAIGNAYNAVKERAYKTITPQDYNIPRATKEFVRGKERNLKAVEPVRNEEWAMYLGVPYEGESNFEPSPYRPTKGKTYDKVLKFKDESKILSDAVLNQMLERQKKTGKTSYLVTGNGGGLGSYTLSLGEDENGKYISYYDDWDINPFKGISATTKIPIVSDIEDIIPGSNPFTVYGRRYYSKKTNKKKSLGGHI